MINTENNDVEPDQMKTGFNALIRAQFKKVILSLKMR